MSKRSVILLILSAIIALATSVAAAAPSALAASVSITDPLNNSTINNVDAPLDVTVNYSDFPDTGSIQVRAYDDTESTVFAQDQNAFATGASGTWQATLDFAGRVTAGTHGHIKATIFDMNGTPVATSSIEVTYGTAAPPPPTSTPTNTPTNVPPPTNTPTATATNIPPGGATITITNPSNGATFGINSSIPVSGTTTSLPSGATVLVRLRNAGGTTMGEQGVVPNGDGTWSLSISKTVPDADPTTTGSLVAFIINGGTTVATSNVVSLNFTGVPTPPSQPSLIISSPTNGATVDTSAPVLISGASSNLPGGTTITAYAYVNGNNSPVGQQVATQQVNGNFAASITFNQFVANGTPGYVIAYATNGGVIATSNQVSVTWGNANSPGVNITQPTNGATVDISHPVHITGTSHNLPIKQVNVIAAYSNGTAINQTTIPVNNAGNWSVNLPVGVQPGTAGLIYAIARDGGNNIVAQKSISVTWGSNNASAVVIINSPTQGSIVYNTVHVEGFGANSFESNIVVRALDTFGNTLAQQPTTYDQNGFWQANFNVNVPPGTPGALFAFITSPQNGSIIASSRVEVYFNGQCYIRTDWPIYVVQRGDTLLRISQRVGTSVTDLAYSNCITNANLVYTGQSLRVPRLPVTPQPQNVKINILTPADNSTVDASQRITVAGSGTGLTGDDVVVRALDTNGNLLAQQTTRVGAADASGNNTWQVSLSLLVDNGTRGTIYAVAQSPTTGAILADALSNVTFSSNTIVIVPPTSGEQKLIITQPTDDGSVSPSGAVQVAGTVKGPFDGDVFVRVIDGQGNVLAETQAQLTPLNDQGDFNWQATLNVNATPGSRGTIYAYVPTPFDATAPIADAVNVIFGQDNGGPYVTITDPMPYQTLKTDDAITISGRGGRLFEGNVVVRALDDNGNVLTEDATTINSPNAGTGGEGDWQITLKVNVAEGTRGSIVAFSTSPQDGSIVAYASVHVIYGDPTNTANFVKITAPLPGTIADPGQTLMIAGTADRQNGNQVHVQIVDEQGNVLVDEPRNLNPAVEGDFGVWQMLIELRGINPGTHLRINALTASRFDGTTLATDSIEIVVGEGE